MSKIQRQLEGWLVKMADATAGKLARGIKNVADNLGNFGDFLFHSGEYGGTNLPYISEARVRKVKELRPLDSFIIGNKFYDPQFPVGTVSSEDVGIWNVYKVR